MINCIAIDDEPLALDLIKKLCQDVPFLNLAKVFTRTSLARRYLKKEEIDLVFLDVQMPDINGLEFYKSLDKKPAVIFTTAHSNYAVEGFNVQAVDYLVKPLKHDRFLVACQKAYQEANFRKSNKNQYRALFVRSNYALVKIPFESIIFMETMDDYIKIHTAEEKPILTLMSMKLMLQKLPSNFVRIHRSYIVALEKVQSAKGKNILLNGKSLPLGATFEKKFFQKYRESN